MLRGLDTANRSGILSPHESTNVLNSGGKMKIGKLLAGVGVLLFAAMPALAQDKPGNIASIEFQKPKNGMVKQYEDGRKAKAAWHKQQNDAQPLIVWETLRGESTGTYRVERVGQHWADLDKPSVPDAADLEEYQKQIGNYVESLVTRYYEFLPKVSNPDDMKSFPKFLEVIIFHVRSGHEADFRSAIGRIHEAGGKSKWPPHYEWFALVNGGADGEYVLAFPHSNWADFEEKPDVKSYRDMVKDAYGQAEADSIVRRLDSSIEMTTSTIIQFRPDLSYLPGK